MPGQFGLPRLPRAEAAGFRSNPPAECSSRMGRLSAWVEDTQCLARPKWIPPCLHSPGPTLYHIAGFRAFGIVFGDGDFERCYWSVHFSPLSTARFFAAVCNLPADSAQSLCSCTVAECQPTFCPSCHIPVDIGPAAPVHIRSGRKFCIVVCYAWCFDFTHAFARALANCRCPPSQSFRPHQCLGAHFASVSRYRDNHSASCYSVPSRPVLPAPDPHKGCWIAMVLWRCRACLIWRIGQENRANGRTAWLPELCWGSLSSWLFAWFGRRFSCWRRCQCDATRTPNTAKFQSSSPPYCPAELLLCWSQCKVLTRCFGCVSITPATGKLPSSFHLLQNNKPALVSVEGFWPATAVVLSEIISYFPQFVDATCSLPGLLFQDTQLQSLSKPRLPSAQAIVQFWGGADADDEAGCLLRSSPLEFNQAFEKLFHADPDRARLIVRYILADLVPFPVEAVKEQLPEVFRMTDTLAQKAGCPFEWAFLLFLPVLGTACAKARLFINEFFWVPPLLWHGLCLDSGANKSGIMTAMADIVSGFEKILLEAALSAAREEAEAQEAAEEAFAEPDESAQKRRKVALSKSLAQIQQNKPALFSDEGSLPAIGMQMSHNGHRAIGLYDEGRFLLRALANGEGSGFNASTMSKLFNGSVWKRTVVKDQNRFAMHQTCLCLAMTFHVEEWHEFLAKDGALGMQSRFLMFHSAPRLEKATKVLDSDGTSPSVFHARRMPEPLLNQFVSILRLADKAHGSTAPDFDKAREFIPYFFAPDALEFFQQHYDAQTVKQEQTYLQDPKRFSDAGKLKSLPWRLSILLHSWTQACRQSLAGEAVELPWSRELSRNVVELSRTIFDYLSLQSQLLAPSSDLLVVLDQAGLLESCAQRYPSLLLLLETNTLPREPLPDQVPVSDTFGMWWSGLTPDAKLYSLLTAHWILTSTTTAVVDQGTCVKKIHSKDTGELLPRDTNKAHCQSAFLLLQYTQVAWLVKKPGAAPRLRKRSYPRVGPSAVAFSNLLHEFRQKHAGHPEEYNSQCVTVTESLKKTCKNELTVSGPGSFGTGAMEAALQILHGYVEEANPFQHVTKVLNVRSASARVLPSQHPELEAAAPAPPALAAGACIARSIDMLAAGSSSTQALLHPLSLDMVPALLLAFHHADPECRDLLAERLLQQQFPTKGITQRDCNFVFAKLLRQAPHMLADRVVLPKDIPVRSVTPIYTSCHFCKRKLRELVTKVVPCISSLDSIEPLAVIFFLVPPVAQNFMVLGFRSLQAKRLCWKMPLLFFPSLPTSLLPPLSCKPLHSSLSIGYWLESIFVFQYWFWLGINIFYWKYQYPKSIFFVAFWDTKINIWNQYLRDKNQYLKSIFFAQ